MLRIGLGYVKLLSRRPPYGLDYSPVRISSLNYYSTSLSLEDRSICRTLETNPERHSTDHESLFYTMSQDDYKRLFGSYKAIPRYFQLQVQTFQESCIMVRKPALEIMGYMKQADYNQFPIKYILYGSKGAGKTTSMCHIMHYCYTQKWIIVHIPWVLIWTRDFGEHSPSLSDPEKYDLPVDAVSFLQRFKLQNWWMIDQFKTSQTYEWSKREETEAGSPLSAIIDQGCNRPKFACECVRALIQEVKLIANSGRAKMLVAVDGVNGLYQMSKIQKDKYTFVHSSKITLVEYVRDLFKFDWKNGALVLVADTFANYPDEREVLTPRYVLGKDCFEDLDPFIPVKVPLYTEEECTSCLEYYNDRKWLQHTNATTDAGREEIIFLSGFNPERLRQVCRNL